MSAKEQTERLADYILGIGELPQSDEGAGDCAMRLLDKYRGALKGVMREFDAPGPGRRAAVTNAYEIAKEALQ